MTETEGMTKLVDRLREGSPAEEHIVPREAVHFLAQAPEGNDRPFSSLVGKPENEVEPSNEDVDIHDAENPDSRRGTGDAVEDDLRVVLPPPRAPALRGEEEGLADRHFLPVHGGERLPEALENCRIDIADRHQEDQGSLPFTVNDTIFGAIIQLS